MSSAKPICTGVDFLGRFDVDDYFTRYYGVDGNSGFLEFNAQCIYRIYYKGDVRGKRLLDIGSGPCLNTVIPAVKYFEEIALSDYSPLCLNSLQTWINSGSGAHDWEPHFRFFNKLEGHKDQWKETERELKSKITSILKCDVNMANPLDPVQNYYADCISSSLCLESACPDLHSYQNAMRNIVSLLKPAGKFLLAGVLNSHCYKVGSETFSSLTITKENVLDAVRMARLEILECYVEPDNDRKDQNQNNIGIVLLAVKK